MASKKKQFVGNAPAMSQVWGLMPPVTADAPTWNLTLNGKTLSYKSNGSPSDALTGMLKLWNAATFPEFKEIRATIPTGASSATNPQGGGTNEIQALYVSGTPTGGSFQMVTIYLAHQIILRHLTHHERPI